MGSSSSAPVADSAPDYSANVPQMPADTQFWTCDPKGSSTIYFSKTGRGSEAKCPPVTLSTLFKQAAEKKGNKVALRVEELPPFDGKTVPDSLPVEKWKSWTYQQYYDDSMAAAKALIVLGHVQHDAVNVFGFNSPQWFMGNMSAILAGGKVAGIYPSDTAEQIKFKVDQSNGSVIFIEDSTGYDKVKSVVDGMPYLKAIVTWACPPGDDITRADGSTIQTLSFEDLLELGKKQENGAVDERIALQKPEHACALIYTSGTTGQPKACMISHDNLNYESFTVMGELESAGVATKATEERIISYLPLSHVAGLMVDVITGIQVAANSPSWIITHFARPYDLKKSTIGARLTAVKPTIFLGVPRVWEKIMEKLKLVGAQTKGIKKKLSTAAKKQALELQRNRQLAGSGDGKVKFVPGKILGIVKKKLGLDQCKYSFTGAAPMTRESLEYFGALNINVNEVYGMSECTGACTFSTDAYHTWGSVGYAVDGCEVKVFKVGSDGAMDECPRTDSIYAATEAEQGEICFRGRNTMMGYMANERLGDEHVELIKSKNAGAIDNNGWIHSGDKGCIDKRGMVKITGRYKELIIGAGGENIAPVPIEDQLKVELPAVSNIIMIGDKRKFNVALIALKVDGATGELPGGDELIGAAAEVTDAKTISEAMNDPAYIEYLTKGFEAVNSNPDVVVSNASKIQKFTILPKDFSVQGGELTATLKLKRSVVEAQYADAIEQIYASSDTFVKCFE